MSEDTLLNELKEILKCKIHKEFVESYIRDKDNGLSAKFDESVKANLDEA